MNDKKIKLGKKSLIAIVCALTILVTFIGYHSYQAYLEQEANRIKEEKAQKKRDKAYAAAEDLRTQIDEYINSWGVGENQIAVCVKDIENDCYVYERNADQWMRAGSIYKLPLSMLWFDRFNAGEASLQDEIIYDRDKYYQDGGSLGLHQSGDILTYEEVIRITMLESDNTGGQILFQTYGGWNQYRQDALRFTDIDMGNRFMLQKNYMTARYLTDVTEHLYKHQDEYAPMIEWLRQAIPGSILDSKIHIQMPQKWGAMELYKNATGFVEAKHPYSIAVFTYGMVYPSSNRMGTINLLCYEYFNQ